MKTTTATKYRSNPELNKTSYNPNAPILMNGLVRKNRIIGIYGNAYARGIGLTLACDLATGRDFQHYKNVAEDDYFVQHISERNSESVVADLDHYVEQTGKEPDVVLLKYSDVVNGFEAIEDFIDSTTDIDSDASPIIVFESVINMDKETASHLFDLIYALDATLIITSDSAKPDEQFLFHSDSLIKVGADKTVHVEKALNVKQDNNQFHFIDSREVH